MCEMRAREECAKQLAAEVEAAKRKVGGGRGGNDDALLMFPAPGDKGPAQELEKLLKKQSNLQGCAP